MTNTTTQTSKDDQETQKTQETTKFTKLNAFNIHGNTKLGMYDKQAYSWFSTVEDELATKKVILSEIFNQIKKDLTHNNNTNTLSIINLSEQFFQIDRGAFTPDEYHQILDEIKKLINDTELNQDNIVIILGGINILSTNEYKNNVMIVCPIIFGENNNIQVTYKTNYYTSDLLGKHEVYSETNDGKNKIGEKILSHSNTDLDRDRDYNFCFNEELQNTKMHDSESNNVISIRNVNIGVSICRDIYFDTFNLESNQKLDIHVVNANSIDSSVQTEQLKNGGLTIISNAHTKNYPVSAILKAQDFCPESEYQEIITLKDIPQDQKIKSTKQYSWNDILNLENNTDTAEDLKNKIRKSLSNITTFPALTSYIGLEITQKKQQKIKIIPFRREFTDNLLSQLFPKKTDRPKMKCEKIVLDFIQTIENLDSEEERCNATIRLFNNLQRDLYLNLMDIDTYIKDQIKKIHQHSGKQYDHELENLRYEINRLTSNISMSNKVAEKYYERQTFLPFNNKSCFGYQGEKQDYNSKIKFCQSLTSNIDKNNFFCQHILLPYIKDVQNQPIALHNVTKLKNTHLTQEYNTKSSVQNTMNKTEEQLINQQTAETKHPLPPNRTQITQSYTNITNTTDNLENSPQL